MSLTPMAPSAWRYYAEEIATGREDYYALAAERPDRFGGRGVEALGLDGAEVSALALERLFGLGADPQTGAPLGRGFSPDNPRAVAGFALTYSPPKTVSVLWALGDAETADAVAAAHDAAVTAALAFVDDHASFTRRGHNGVLQVDTAGLLAASFVHRTSRAADPQLHTHVLVANKVRAEDGKWLTLDARELFEHQKAAGMLYKAALRAELTQRLGVAWTPVDDNGIAEIVGVPPVLVEYWSARRHELKAVGDELIARRAAEVARSLSANERAQCFQIAAYRTRTPKVDADTPTAELRERWAEEARAWRQSPEEWIAKVARRHAEVAFQKLDELVPTVVARLENRAATWGRSDVVEEATRLVTAPDADETRHHAEVLSDRVLRDPAVVSLAGPLPAEPPAWLYRRDGMAAMERHGAVRFSTARTLAQEAAILEAVEAGRDARAGVVPRVVVDRALGRSVLGDDQRDAVRGLLTGGEQVALMVGPAGAGKSRALDAAREAWEAANYRTIGLAPSAMAASVLAEEAGITSDTLAKFLLDLERDAERLRLDRKTVVVLDEAGMARTDDFAKLLAAVRDVSAKLVLVGDPQQLGAVGPGGVFRTLVGDHGAYELETVRRFDHAWEAAASLRLRARDPAVLSAYFRHDRIEDGSREQMLDRAFETWRAAREQGASIVLMAGDNATANELARRCRADRVRRLEVDRDGVPISSGIAGFGDEIVTLKNDRSLRSTPEEFVRNGARWHVIDATDDGGLKVVPFEGRGLVTLPSEYVREHVALGYALTVHKAQGSTTDRALVLVDGRMTAAQLYVAMSRGRKENRAFVICSDDAPEDHVRRPSVDAIELLAAVMRHDGADRSAHEVMRQGLARYDNVELLADLYEEARQANAAAIGPDHREEITALEGKASDRWVRDGVLQAEGEISRAEARCRQAEAHVANVEHEPLRARLPGRLGADARYDADQTRRYARWYLDEARRTEEKALQHYKTARQRLAEAERSAERLAGLRETQARRETWLREHPDELRWESELRTRLLARQRERTNARSRGDLSDERGDVTENTGPTRLPRAKQLDIEAPGASVTQQAKEHEMDPALEGAPRWSRAPGYLTAPEPPPHSVDRGGPVLGR